MDAEMQQMQATAAWPRLLQAIDAHGRDLQRTLAVHTSMCNQPEHAPALVASLEAAGLRQAHVTGSGAWTVSLDLPAMFAQGDGAPIHITVQGDSEGAVRKELLMHYDCYNYYVSPTTYYLLRLLLLYHNRSNYYDE